MNRSIIPALGLAVLIGASSLAAANKSYDGRISLFGQAGRSSYEGSDGALSSELVLRLTFRSRETAGDGFEYGLDVRGAGYPSAEDRSRRLSVYDAFAGAKFGHGAFAFRLGLLWLNRLGGLGSLGGGVFEFRLPAKMPFGRFGAGVFGGYEPKINDAGFVPGVKKFGGFLALEGEAARRHVLAYINLRNENLTERSVLVFNNYVPIGRTFFFYQSAEYDLLGPAGTGAGSLTHIFVNARLAPVSWLELQAMFQRGRSFDTRTISDDRLNGRPIDPRTLEGFLFESIGGRATLRVPRWFHLYAGYSRDRNNFGDARYDRLSVGLYASNLFRTGLELNVSDGRMTSKSGSSYDSWYVSLGKSLSQAFYAEGFYSSSVSVFRLMGGGEFRIDSYPRSRRFGVSTVWNILPSASLQLTAERTRGDRFSEFRFLSGLSTRF